MFDTWRFISDFLDYQFEYKIKRWTLEDFILFCEDYGYDNEEIVVALKKCFDEWK